MEKENADGLTFNTFRSASESILTAGSGNVWQRCHKEIYTPVGLVFLLWVVISQCSDRAYVHFYLIFIISQLFS